MKRKFTLLAAALVLLSCLAVPLGMWGQTTYELQQVTSVEAGGLYVFEQDGHVMNNTVSSNALQTTTTYSTTGLAGTESYVWTLETATNGFYMRNVSLSSGQYLNNGSSTNVSFGNKSSIWAFDFQNDNTVLIQNKSNSDRYLGYTNPTSYAYKAYATSNMGYSHAIKVYQLVEEGPVTYTVTYNANGASGNVPVDENIYSPTYNTVTVLGNVGTPNILTKTGHHFSGWNTNADTTGTNYAAGDQFTISANTILYAKWRPNKHNVIVTGANHGTVTGFTNPVAYNTVVTLTYTHNDGEYYSATFSTSDATIYGSDNNKFIMPDKDVTITVTETPLPVYTVTYSDGGSVTEAHYGAGVTLATRSGDGTYSFAGWTTSNIATETTTAPETILTGTYYPTDNITLYPVYTRSEGSGTVWRKLANPSLVDEGTYALITSENKAFNGTITSGVGQVTSTNFSFNDNNEAESAPEGTCELTFTAVSGGYTMYNPTHKYLYAKAASSGNLAWHDTEDEHWYYTYESYAYRWVYSKSYSGSYAMLRGYTSSPHTFRTYSSSGYNGYMFNFVKKVSNSITYYISTLSSIAVPSFDPTSQNFSTASLSVTITVASDCYIKYTTNDWASYTMTSSNTVTIEIDGTTTVKAIAKNGSNESAEVSQTYTKVYNVALSSNGVVAAPIEVAAGESTTLTAPLNIPAGFSFMGWTATPSSPSTLVSDTYTPSANVTLYAVFGKEIYGDFKKVTSEPSNWNGYYLIVFETRSVALDGSLVDMDVSKNTIDVSIDNSGNIATIATNDVTNASKFMFAPITGGYSIRSASGYYIGRTENKNGLDMNATTPYVNTLSYSSGPVITASAGPRLLCWSQGGAEPTWKISYYASNQNAIQLYKQEVIATEGNYIRVFQNETATAAIEIVGPSIIPSGSMLDMGEYILSNNDPANLIIEDGGQLYANDVVEATIKKNISKYTIAANDNTDPDNVVLSNGWYLISYPLNCDYTQGGDDPTGVTNLITNNSIYDLYLFDPAANQYNQENGEEWVNYKAHSSDFKLITGHGYLYSNAADVTLEFAGSVNYTDPENPGISLENGYNLVGNPYTYNAYPSVSYYKMNNDGTAITADLCTDVVLPCTGIIVDNSDGSITDITFSKNQPVVGGAFNGSVQMTLAQTVTTRGESNTKTLDNAILSFNEGSQLGKFYFGTQNANLYIPQGNKEYAIVSSEGQGEMPVNFKANENGQYTITVNPENVEMNYLHLIDNMTGADVDLLQEPSYTFNAKTTDYESRFRLVFASSANGNENDNESFAFLSNGQLIIANEGQATLQVIDITGRILSSETINGSCSKSLNAPAGVYMLRLINGNDVKVQKIVVR